MRPVVTAIERLERARGNRTEAARLLGIRRALLCDRMCHFGLDRSKNVPDAT